MGFFTRSTSKQTAKLKSLVKLALARLAVVRRPRVGRRSIARGDVAQLLSIGHLDRALVRAGQVIEEDDALAALDVLELYCRLLVDHAAQLDKPKECTEEIRAAAAGLIYASARCGELPELLDARAILADKFGRDFAAAARDGAPGVVDPTLVQKLSGQGATVEQMRRLAKEIAAENGILLEFPEDTREVPHAQGKQSEQAKMSVPAAKSVEQAEIEPCVVQNRQRPADQSVNRPSLTQLSSEQKVPRESKQYRDVRMAAEAAFESASFAAMAARAAVELSRTESQGKGWRGGGGGGHDKVHPVAERETLPPGKPQKTPSPLPSPSWSDHSTVSSVWSDPPQKGKTVVFDESDAEDDDEVVADLVRIPQLRRPPYGRAASTAGVGAGQMNGSRRPTSGEAGVFQDGVSNGPQHPMHRRHASELAGGNAHHREEAQGQRGVYRAPPPPPYRRNPSAANGNGENGATRRAGDLDGGRGGAYESSAYVARAPYARIASALEGGNEHIARHEEVRRIGTDARVLQEKLYGPAAPGPGRAPMTPERRTISVRTRR
ncbi:hypothetical protein QYE76_069182 [Lolium multiflorum]|uniref:Regulator of Vps4 activity in the MVB pathway protein n=1 Tax=Lolium multiflorum TaxID=4521 RepID=A0AAD8WEN8_LOLMU|nr:hypothetical protein QYE76_069182 [Lolium multiflorum]